VTLYRDKQTRVIIRQTGWLNYIVTSSSFLGKEYDCIIIYLLSCIIVGWLRSFKMVVIIWWFKLNKCWIDILIKIMLHCTFAAAAGVTHIIYKTSQRNSVRYRRLVSLEDHYSFHSQKVSLASEKTTTKGFHAII